MYFNVDFFIGIDQSINSTGITFQVYGKTDSILSKYGLLEKHFYIITGKDKLTKKEEKAQITYKDFDYVRYEKKDIKTANNSHTVELYKTYNLMKISRTIIGIISSYTKKYYVNEKINCYVCMEGVSYQSSNTSSIIELAGLNYIIRYDLIRYFNGGVTEALQAYNTFELVVSPPAEIKKFASGNGAAKKEVMVGLFEASHPNLYLIPKIDDIADSYWMSEYVANIYKRK